MHIRWLFFGFLLVNVSLITSSPENSSQSRQSLEPTQETGERYLHWTLEARNIHCAGVGHMRASFSTFLCEAKMLGRTAVFPNTICMHPVHTGLKNLKYMSTDGIFNLEAINSILGVRVILHKQFSEEVPSSERRKALVINMEKPNPPTPKVLLRSTHQVIVRRWNKGSGYWFTARTRYPALIAHLEMSRKAVSQPAAKLEKIITKLVQALKQNYATIHSRRGDKLSIKYPGLRYHTSGEGILNNNEVKNRLPRGTTIWLMSNEKNLKVFQSLFTSTYWRVFHRTNFSHWLDAAQLNAYEAR
jgi:hypothetical protein